MQGHLQPRYHSKAGSLSSVQRTNGENLRYLRVMVDNRRKTYVDDVC